LRKRGDLSQEELGVLAGMHRTELSSLERGEREPRLANVLKLAGGIGVDPAVLVEVLPALDAEGIPKKAGRPPRSDEPPGTPDAPTRDPEMRMPTRADRLPANGGTFIVAPAYQVGRARSAAAGRSFSDKVVSLREERGWTQRELAIRAGVARTEITKVELGARLPPADVALRLASGFDLVPGDLLEGIPPPALPPDLRMMQQASPIEGPPVDEADLADRLARNLVTLRRRRGLSQSDLARASGVDRGRINGFEEKTTMPQVVTLGKLAGALSVPVSTLIDELLPDDDPVGVR
jgi:transcriptional regulator with XRE-family HTH domain